MGINYTDFDLSMKPNSNGDINQLSDDGCIIQVIKNSVSLNSFEIPFNKEYASNIRKYLFDNPNKIHEVEIKKSIISVLEMDARLSKPEVDITYSNSFQSCYIHVIVYVGSLSEKVSYTIQIDKAR